MTKKDIKYAVGGGVLGLGAFLLLWWLRKKKTIPEINPAVVKWESL
jgi:hypothetical protein